MTEKGEPWVLEIGQHCTRLGRSGEIRPLVSEASIVGAPRVPDDLSLRETGVWPLSPSVKMDHTLLVHPLTGGHPDTVGPGSTSPSSEALHTILRSSMERIERGTWSQAKCLVIEPSTGLRGYRETIGELLFEHFELESILFQKTAPLALYACARTSGLNIDLGHHNVVLSAVQEGLACKGGVATLPTGGEYIVDEFIKELRTKEIELPPYYEVLSDPIRHHPFVEDVYRRWAVRGTAEKLLFGTGTGAHELLARLPDGEAIGSTVDRLDISHSILHRDGDAKAMTLGETLGYVAEASGLFGNIDQVNSITVCGGLARSDKVVKAVQMSIRQAQESCHPNPDFLGGLPPTNMAQWEIDKTTPLPWGWRLLYPKEEDERALMSFIGGSILGSLAVFDAVSVDKRTYSEYGTRAYDCLG